jgi:hypothetical protein
MAQILVAGPEYLADAEDKRFELNLVHPDLRIPVEWPSKEHSDTSASIYRFLHEPFYFGNAIGDCRTLGFS